MKLSRVITGKKMPRNLKVKLYMTVVRPVLLYGAEVWTIGKKEERMLEATEMRMLRRIRGVTLKDRMRSNDIRKELRIENIKDKVRETRMRWFGHVVRMDDKNTVKQTMLMAVPGKRPRGRPRKRWRENIKEDLRHFSVEPQDALDRIEWRTRTKAAYPTERDQRPYRKRRSKVNR